MRKTAVMLALVAAAATALIASDRTGVYAVIDKVVFEPSAENPQRVQLWGTFTVAVPDNRNDYQAPARGYLYLTLTHEPHVVRAEWNDLKSVAGTKQIVAFGTRFGQNIGVRPASDPPQNPDPHPVGVGVRRIPADRDYEPIRLLAASISR